MPAEIPKRAQRPQENLVEPIRHRCRLFNGLGIRQARGKVTSRFPQAFLVHAFHRCPLHRLFEPIQECGLRLGHRVEQLPFDPVRRLEGIGQLRTERKELSTIPAKVKPHLDDLRSALSALQFVEGRLFDCLP
ncbi:MAG TPA: hypothetical protein VEL76_02175 [Gemmataceae bacterium]|nr:hypothetical protein [Gemmataceae bacterium]